MATQRCTRSKQYQKEERINECSMMCPRPGCSGILHCKSKRTMSAINLKAWRDWRAYVLTRKRSCDDPRSDSYSNPLQSAPISNQIPSSRIINVDYSYSYSVLYSIATHLVSSRSEIYLGDDPNVLFLRWYQKKGV